ncbi:asparagine synthase (glutamine-hydrolyzing) [Nonomuraea sp. NPDC049725]|uniref:asparagine synthase (glutamine-hydrolyzing) n=1 Tax=Nonomuraea sp. NPDC049725 TaxID=3154508 RepID=UPI00343A4105
MCGIAAIIDPRVVAEDAHRLAARDRELIAMLAKIWHRGDPECFAERRSEVGAALGANRLAIVDREHAQQPQSDQHGRIWVAYNGELYGFQDVRRELERLGHRFRTTSDTEVIAQAYAEWGPDMLGRFNGMFAFVVFDSERRTFLAARDHVGMKPLYYVVSDGVYRFASEQKCLLGVPGEIRTLPPGSYLTERGVTRYHQLDDTPCDLPERDMVARYRELFDDAVRRQVDTDLPVAVTFSGGIDSAAVLASARLHHPAVTALTIGFEGAADIEVARRYCQEHDIPHVVAHLNRDALVDIIPDIVYGAEFFEAIDVMDTCVGYFAFELAKRHGFKLALCGEGSDEVMAGYDLFRHHHDPVDLMRYRVANLHRTDLQRVDRSSMMNSVETRVPFMDRHLLEFAYSVPMEMKLRGGVDKWLLREAFKDRLPAYITNRPKIRMPDGSGMKNTLVEYARAQDVEDDTLAKSIGIDSREGAYFLERYLEAGFPMPAERFKRAGYDYSPNGYFEFVS